MDQSLASQQFCYLTTVGRKTGRPHQIEIWFALRDTTAYLLSGGREKSDWVKNLMAEPAVTIRIADTAMPATGRTHLTPDEEAWARAALVDKYQPTYSEDLTNWGRTSLPIAIDLALPD
jgi:deazaflavin-dependent oxidoreductase (nitroreductase family)